MDARGTPRYLHHVGWVVASIERAKAALMPTVGMTDLGIDDIGWVRIAFLGVGCSMIELLEPVDQTSDLGVFLAQGGDRIHHLAYAVGDVQVALDAAGARGVTLLDEAPKPGARDTQIAFVAPRTSDGVSFEFVADASAPPCIFARQGIEQ